MQKLVPYPHQTEDIWRAISEPTQGILIASEQDQGKTLMTIETLLALGLKRVLIVGIKDSWEQWRDRALAQSDGTQTVLNIDSTKGQANLDAYASGADGWYFIGHSLLTRRDYEQYQTKNRSTGEMVNKSRRISYWESMPRPDAVVVDEIHLVANYNSKGRETLHSIHADWKIALSGTFYGNKFANAWAPAAWLWPELIEPYNFWYGKWCEERPALTKGGKPVLTPHGRAVKILVGEKEEGTFVSTLPCYIRRVSEDGIPDPKVITVGLNPEQRRIYGEIETQQLAYLKGHPWVQEVPISARSALKTVTLATPTIDPLTDEISFDDDATSSKIDALLVELAGYPDERVIISTDRKRFAKLVVSRMRAQGLRVVEWSGDVNSAGRSEIKQQWLSNEIDYIVCVMKSFSTALDWAQFNCWRIGVLSSPEGDPTTKQQFLKRVFRTGPTKLRFQWFEILAENTYDFGIFENIELQALAQSRTLA